LLKRGFTLIELVVALGLLSVVLLFVFDTFSYQQATHSVVDQISETQQNTQAISRLIERDLRNAGYLIPPGAAACGADSTSAPDSLFVSDTDAILPADQLPVEYNGKELGAKLTDLTDEPTAAGAKTMDVDEVTIDGVASYDTDANGANDSDFRVGGGAILVDTANPARGVACGIVTAVGITAPLSVSANFLAVYNSAGAAQTKQLRLVPAHVYQIVAGPPPELRRDGVLLAKDIEDLQVAWFYDDDTDQIVDAGEMRGVAGTNLDTTAVTGSELREVRFNLVARTRANDPRNPDDAGIGQARENRATSIPAADGKHRRVQTATVRLRNLTL
jgi:prepilin-type N-terminal cleavage/methylation domain-containing protein